MRGCEEEKYFSHDPTAHAPVAQPAAESGTSTHTNDLGLAFGTNGYTTQELPGIINRLENLRRAEIMSIETYAEGSFMAHHFLLLELNLANGTKFWLRLDRLRTKISLVKFLHGSSHSSANDTAQLSPSRRALDGGAMRKNKQTFKVNPTLADLARILRAMCREMAQYSLWPQNCFFFCSVLQELFEKSHSGTFSEGTSLYRHLARGVRQRVKAALDPVFNRQRLVICFHIGQVHSTVRCALMRQGKPTIIGSIDQWPGQDSRSLEQVPTCVLYGGGGEFIACGAKAATKASEDDAPTPEHLTSNRESSSQRTRPLGCLFRIVDSKIFRGKEVSALRFYSDYLNFLSYHTQSYLRTGFGCDIWQESEQEVEIVLSHPFGNGPQQKKFFRKAAVSAGLVSWEGAERRLHFVGQAEAAAFYAIANNAELVARLQGEAKFVLCEADDHLVTISAYRLASMSHYGEHLEQMDGPSYLHCGASDVDKALQAFLCAQLAAEEDFSCGDVDYSHGIIEDGLKDFASFGKCEFSSSADTLKVRLGGRSINYPSLHMKNGVIHIEGSTAADFFDPCIDLITAELARHMEYHGTNVLIATGSFVQSQYFRQSIMAGLGGDRFISFTDAQTAFAISDGALRLTMRKLNLDA